MLCSIQSQRSLIKGTRMNHCSPGSGPWLIQKWVMDKIGPRVHARFSARMAPWELLHPCTRNRTTTCVQLTAVVPEPNSSLPP